MAKRPNQPKRQLPQEMNAEQALMTAQNALNSGNYSLAASLMIRLCRAVPDFAPAQLAVGVAFSKMGRNHEAIARLTRMLEINEDPDQPAAPTPQVEMGRKFNSYMARIEAARCQIRLGDLDAAAESLDRAIPVTESTQSLEAHKARLDVARGNPQAALDRLQPLLEAEQIDVEAALVATELALAAPEILPPSQAAEYALQTSRRVGLPAGVLIDLLQATGRVLHAADQHEEALAAWRRAVTIPRVEFRPRVFMREVLATMQGWTPDSISKVVRSDTDDETPVLVVGMPGLGLGAIANLIAAHPEAENAGASNFLSEVAANEFNASNAGNFTSLHRPGIIRGNETRAAGTHYSANLRVRAGKTEAARVVDANADNIMHLGMVSLMNPNARIVHVSNDPFASCLDAYSTSSAHVAPYIREHSTLTLFWRGDFNLARHWRTTFEHDKSRQPWHDLDLRDLQKEPEQTARALFMFLGLDWQPELAEAAADAVKGMLNHKPYIGKLKSLSSTIERASLAPEDIERDAAVGDDAEHEEAAADSA